MAAALDAMARRGPNDRGTETIATPAGDLVFGHTRLSVIDLSAGGHQPMHGADGRLSLIFNGEIYNYRELRRELQLAGAQFRTESDTEVLLQAWSRWGEACLPRLVGMFAFALFDRAEGVLTCVRDPFGIKPFFYNWDAQGFAFASELPAVKALLGGKVSLDLQRAYDYLVHGDYDTSERSFLQGVRHLMPGHLLRVRLGQPASAPVSWWQPRVSPVQKLSFEQAAEAFREKLLHSVRLHLRSDVALGAALSGGLDSSSIVCAMRHVEPGLPIHTFSYVARGSAVSEEAWVDRINAHVGAVGHKVELAPEELANDLEDMIVAQGEPFGSTSIYAQYRVFKLAREHGVTVTLDGQGADELLAGYNGYPGKRARSLLDEHRYGDAWRFLQGWAQWPDRVLREGAKAAVAEWVDGPVYDVLRKLNGNRTQPDWLDAEALRQQGVHFRFPRQRSPYDQPGRRLVSELAHSITRRGLSSLLRHGDRNSMRFSVESRVPFLTTELADFLLTLPEEYLISPEGETKRILRAAMRGIVPDEVLDRRDKIGFSTPEQAWLQQIAPQVRQWLGDDVGLGFLRRDRILAEFDAVIAGRAPFSWQVWRWINFTRWYARFFAR
ncbi:asparagine synthase (glutamine-hydrolyzing) [Ramlibacter tataouinensis]|nr:asparagine synthase (glutamine-hydrolyzing) [Ramlibacter tataouinensis]WBY00728.1 asparagine synthase (glutamine-hydrolyzing) [Ramlibacter tataouinensis]